MEHVVFKRHFEKKKEPLDLFFVKNEMDSLTTQFVGCNFSSLSQGLASQNYNPFRHQSNQHHNQLYPLKG